MLLALLEYPRFHVPAAVHSPPADERAAVPILGSTSERGQGPGSAGSGTLRRLLHRIQTASGHSTDHRLLPQWQRRCQSLLLVAMELLLRNGPCRTTSLTSTLWLCWSTCTRIRRTSRGFRLTKMATETQRVRFTCIECVWLQLGVRKTATREWPRRGDATTYTSG